VIEIMRCRLAVRNMALFDRSPVATERYDPLG